MKGKIIIILLGLAFLSGCAVNNPHLAKMPLFEARTDTITGLDSPRERVKAIREKGKQGEKASASEQEILVAQLAYEYQTCPDPNMRREAVDALAKIPHPDRDRYMQEILKDNEPFVRLSALEALGKTYSGNKRDLTTLLLHQIKTDTDKDVRLSSVRILGDVCKHPQSKI
jgi:HEAT repeat protein